MYCKKVEDLSTTPQSIGVSYKKVVPDLKKKKRINIRPKIMNCVFIKDDYNNSAYQFLMHRSSIEDIHPNTIIESMDVTFFEDVFPFNKAYKNCSL
jgi:hypothetical protein